MPEMSLAEAAVWAGKGRPAILKAIKREHNRLSARQDDKGQWWIDPAELARVYPPGNAGNSSQTAGEQLPGTTEIALMRELVDAARRETARVEQERDDWKAEAAKWQEEAAAVRLITHQKAPADSSDAQPGPLTVIPAPEGAKVPRGMLARLAAAGKALAGR